MLEKLFEPKANLVLPQLLLLSLLLKNFFIYSDYMQKEKKKERRNTRLYYTKPLNYTFREKKLNRSIVKLDALGLNCW